MPVEFLTDARAAAYGGFVAEPTRAELERCCFLDDADLRRVDQHRGDHSRLGYALQLVTVRAVGTFLADPLDVPTVVVDYVAAQVGVADASVVKRYTERRSTRFEHQGEITAAYGYRSFTTAEQELAGWIADTAWTSGEGPTALFDGAVGWLRKRQVLLPGLSRLVRLVAAVRDRTTQRLYDTLAQPVPWEKAAELVGVCEVPGGGRVSQLEQWRHPPRHVSGLALLKAINRVAEIAGLGSRRWMWARCRRGGWSSWAATGWPPRRRRCGGIRTRANSPPWWPRCAGWRLRRSTMRWSCLTC